MRRFGTGPAVKWLSHLDLQAEGRRFGQGQVLLLHQTFNQVPYTVDSNREIAVVITSALHAEGLRFDPGQVLLLHQTFNQVPYTVHSNREIVGPVVQWLSRLDLQAEGLRFDPGQVLLLHQTFSQISGIHQLNEKVWYRSCGEVVITSAFTSRTLPGRSRPGPAIASII
uniref:Phosphotriesterase-related protein n=1 Tax=Angiostrongylus cantonensis TaxID=6313 RepID=A0A0K0D8U2_ANGCA